LFIGRLNVVSARRQQSNPFPRLMLFAQSVKGHHCDWLSSHSSSTSRLENSHTSGVAQQNANTMPLMTLTIGHLFATSLRCVIAIAPPSAAHRPLRKGKFADATLALSLRFSKRFLAPLEDGERY